MAKKFRDLRAKMTKESQARAHEKAQAMLSELPLAELRQARHFSQEQLAAELDVPRPHPDKLLQDLPYPLRVRLQLLHARKFLLVGAVLPHALRPPHLEHVGRLDQR